MRERRDRTSNRQELNGGSSSVVLDWLSSGSKIENWSPVEGEEAAFRIVILGLLVDCKGGASVSSGEAGLEGIFEGE